MRSGTIQFQKKTVNGNPEKNSTEKYSYKGFVWFVWAMWKLFKSEADAIYIYPTKKITDGK